MAHHPGLNHISIRMLCTAAGGDPWQVDETLQAGDPGQISELSRAFFNAGDCTTESYADFADAQKRFRTAWSRETGEHPINDSAEVQRALRSLTFQHERIPVVAATLAGIAAALAEAQRSSSREISMLDAQLRNLDELIGRAVASRLDPLPMEDNAVESTRTVLSQVRSLRDAYSAELAGAMAILRLDCHYDPAIDDVDGDGAPAAERLGHDSVQHYDTNQRAKDEELVCTGDPWSLEISSAAGRLADYALATDPDVDDRARALATERIDDFRMAQFVGPLPQDPILGQDARGRARSRLQLQDQLEKGAFGLPPTTRDEATGELDDGEHFGRVAAVQQAVYRLTRLGISGEGARSIVWNWAHQGNDIADKAGLAASGVQTYAKSYTEGSAKAAATGLHVKPSPLSVDDAAKWGRVAGRVATAGNIVQFGVATAELIEGGDTKFEEFGGALGGMAGGSAAGWGAAMAAGSLTGPWTTAAIIVAASYLGGQAGADIGGGIGGYWDPDMVTAGGGGRSG